MDANDNTKADVLFDEMKFRFGRRRQPREDAFIFYFHAPAVLQQRLDIRVEDSGFFFLFAFASRFFSFSLLCRAAGELRLEVELMSVANLKICFRCTLLEIFCVFECEYDGCLVWLYVRRTWKNFMRKARKVKGYRLPAFETISSCFDSLRKVFAKIQ